jgi:hypothetical protein
MKEFICIDCGCTFRISLGEGYPFGQQTCPNCRSINIERMENKQQNVQRTIVKRSRAVKNKS